MDPSTSAAALKLEIARLTGAINRRKSEDSKPARAQSFPAGPSRPRNNVYVNPNYKPPSTSKPVNTTVQPPSTSSFKPQVPSYTPSSSAKDVVIGGVAFQSSARSLVRKDLPKSTSTASRPPSSRPPPLATDYARQKPVGRVYKPKASRGRPRNRNMTLNNTRRPHPSGRSKRAKYVDKPCPRFTTTGSCNRGLTCPYQHDPSKIAICWPFLQGSCPNTAETCNLSHDPTPNRTPLCVHFANNGRCTRQNCPFPHVRVGQRQGVCRDFAVLGYCEKGLDCDKQHVRECPDFAEKGACTNKGCKLPHVIRANRKRATASGTSASTATAIGQAYGTSEAPGVTSSETAGTDVPSVPQVTVEDAQLGDEYISLTFHESEEESDDEDDEEDDDEGEDEDEEHDEQADEDAPMESDPI